MHDWNIKITHYTLFRKDKVGKCKRGVALNIKRVSVEIRCLSSYKAFQALLRVLHLKTCKKMDGREYQFLEGAQCLSLLKDSISKNQTLSE